MSRFTGLQFTGLPCLPVFFFVPPRHLGLPVVCRYTGVVHFFMLAEPLLLLHTPTHAAAPNTTQHAGCCGQQPTLAYTPCHLRQENYANLVTALPPQNSPAAAHAEIACTAFAVILMTMRKSTASGWCCHGMDLVMNNDKHFMFLELFQSSALLLVHLKHCCRN